MLQNGHFLDVFLDLRQLLFLISYLEATLQKKKYPQKPDEIKQ